MANEYIFDASPENFHSLVIANSQKGPVLVNFWSAKAGPCLKLWPSLEQLSNEFAGRFLLVNVNTDKYHRFVQDELGVRSVPTLQLYIKQQVVDVVHGAESEQSLRALLHRHLPRDSDSLLANSIKQYNNSHNNPSQKDKTIQGLMQLQSSDPQNPRIATSIIKLLFREKRFAEMQNFFNSQSSLIKNNEDMISLMTHAKLQLAAARVKDIDQLQQSIKANPHNTELAFQLAAVNALNNNTFEAMDCLLQILKTDASFEDGLAAKAMVLLLNSLAVDSPELKQYRMAMLDVLSNRTQTLSNS